MNSRTLSLHHLVRPPEVDAATASGKPPLLLLLHGVGSNEEDLFSLTPFLDERFVIVSVRAPYTLGPGQYGWYHIAFGPNGIDYAPDEAERSRQALIAFIREAVNAYGADPARVYLLGFSQGAIMSLSVMLTEPELLAGVVAMSGMLPRDVLTYTNMGDGAGNAAQARIAAPERLKNFPVLVVHGVYDDVLPIQQGRALRQYLAALPVRLDYREYPMRHQISDQSLDDVCGWLIERLDMKNTEHRAQNKDN